MAAVGYMIASDAIDDSSATEFREIVEILNAFELRQLVVSAQLKMSYQSHALVLSEHVNFSCLLLLYIYWNFGFSWFVS